MKYEYSNKIILYFIIFVLAIFMCNFAYIQYNEINSAKEIQKIKNLDLYTIETDIEYESMESERDYYENPADLNLKHLEIFKDRHYLTFDMNDSISNVYSSLHKVLVPESKDSIKNSDEVIYTHMYELYDTNNFYVKFSSNPVDTEEELSFYNRKIDRVDIFNIENVKLFGNLQNGKVTTLLNSLGNPTYKYTETIKNKLTTEEYKITYYVYESGDNNLLVITSDNENIDRISIVGGKG